MYVWIMLCYKEVSDLTYFQKVILILESGVLFQTSSGCRIFQLCVEACISELPCARREALSFIWQLNARFLLGLVDSEVILHITPLQTSWKICTDFHHFYPLIKIEIFKIPMCDGFIKTPMIVLYNTQSHLWVRHVKIVSLHIRFFMFLR